MNEDVYIKESEVVISATDFAYLLNCSVSKITSGHASGRDGYDIVKEHDRDTGINRRVQRVE